MTCSSQGSADAQHIRNSHCQSQRRSALRTVRKSSAITDQSKGISCFVSRFVKMSTTNRCGATDQSRVTNPMYQLDSAPQDEAYLEVLPQPVCIELKKEKEDNPPDLREDRPSTFPKDNERESLFCLILLYCSTLLLVILSFTTFCLASHLWFHIAHFSMTTVLQTTPTPTQPSCRCTG